MLPAPLAPLPPRAAATNEVCGCDGGGAANGGSTLAATSLSVAFR
jgi:hypothetical protein